MCIFVIFNVESTSFHSYSAVTVEDPGRDNVVSAKSISIAPIMQEHDLGCGIACVAMLANKRYEQVAAVVLRKKNEELGETNRTRINVLKKYLTSFHVPHDSRRGKSWGEIEGLAIVGVNEDSEGNWHWVVYINDGKRKAIIDPSKENAIVVFGNTEKWQDEPEGYWLAKRRYYISIPMEVDSIVI